MNVIERIRRKRFTRQFSRSIDRPSMFGETSGPSGSSGTRRAPPYPSATVVAVSRCRVSTTLICAVPLSSIPSRYGITGHFVLYVTTILRTTIRCHTCAISPNDDRIFVPTFTGRASWTIWTTWTVAIARVGRVAIRRSTRGTVGQSGLARIITGVRTGRRAHEHDIRALRGSVYTSEF